MSRATLGTVPMRQPSNADIYRRLLLIARELNRPSSVPPSDNVVTEFLELASRQIELKGRLGSVELKTESRHARLPESVELALSEALPRAGIEEPVAQLLVASSIEALREAALAEDPHLLEEEKRFA